MRSQSQRKHYTATDKRYRKMQWQVLFTLLFVFFVFVFFVLFKWI